MDKRLKKLEDLQKKKDEIEIAKAANQLMVEGGTDACPTYAQLENDGNVSRQIYSAVGHETLQSVNDEQAHRIIENAKQQLPYHDNQSRFLKGHVPD